jgi:hypothetical protein
LCEIHRHHAHDYLMNPSAHDYSMNPSATSADWWTVQLEPAYEVMIHSLLIWICLCGALQPPVSICIGRGFWRTACPFVDVFPRVDLQFFVSFNVGRVLRMDRYGCIDTNARYRRRRISETVLSMKKRTWLDSIRVLVCLSQHSPKKITHPRTPE